MRHILIYALFLLSIFVTSCKGQNKNDLAKPKSETKIIAIPNAPNSITRSIVQDKMGNIWLATFEGIFRYDGNSFTNMTSDVTSDRFFSVLEDRKGNFWFGSIGAGVFYYDGVSFQNFTTNEGLVNNEIGCIYEDEIGNVWFGANGGLSRYDGKSFQNYIKEGAAIVEDNTGKIIPNLQRPSNEVNAIIEDKEGKIWIGTRGNTFVYDGKAFIPLIHNGKSFVNVRSIIKDRKDNIWLGGFDGLWRYDGNMFTNVSQHFVGSIYEDKNGNIWTSSQNTNDRRWTLSRYDEKSLTDIIPTETEIKSANLDNQGMIFGILEAEDGHIWFGALDGAYRYDGNTITGFTDKASWKQLVVPNENSKN